MLWCFFLWALCMQGQTVCPHLHPIPSCSCCFPAPVLLSQLWWWEAGKLLQSQCLVLAWSWGMAFPRPKASWSHVVDFFPLQLLPPL